VQYAPVAYAVRNLLRRAGVEMVPAQAGSSLLGVHLDVLFSTFEIACVLDVGARCGDYGIWLRRNGYNGDIISFEPIKENYEALVEASAHDAKWYCANYALGVEDGIASINVSKYTQFSSFHQPNSTATALFGGASTVQRLEEVEIRRLDSVLEALPVKISSGRTYLKLDTQGWDLQVLAGADRVLDQVIALQTEVAVQPIYDGMPLMAESLAAIDEYGFTPSGFFPVNLDTRLALVEFDLVAVRTPRSRESAT
jgi:FkbM family methyltransferase